MQYYVLSVMNSVNVTCSNQTLLLCMFGTIIMPDALAVVRAHQGLPVGFLWLRYSVLFTVESLYLLYLLVIS